MSSYPARDISDALTYAEARAAGISRRQLQGPGFVRLARGLYVPITTEGGSMMARGPNIRQQATAALKVAGPGAFLSHHLAAQVYGGVVPHTPDLHVSVPPEARRSAPEGIRVHVSARAPTHFSGIPITSPVDTFLEMAACLHLVDLVVLGDSLVRKGRVTPEQLRQEAASASGRGVRIARRAAAWVRSQVDSPMESKTRMLMVLGGLPEPEVNIIITDAYGRVVRRLDMGYRERKLALEYEGRQHAESTRQWEIDITRRRELEDDGWRIISLLAKDIYRTPGATLSLVRSALRARGGGLPPVSHEWLRYFPVQERPF